MDDQHHPTGHPDGSTAPPDGGQALWDSTVAALAAAGIGVVQAGDGRPGAVLELGPRGLAVAVRWQPTEQHPPPGGVLSLGRPLSPFQDGSTPGPRSGTDLWPPVPGFADFPSKAPARR